MSCSRLKSIWNKAFKIFNAAVPSLEPPPNPAPIGIILCKCICMSGSDGKSAFNKWYAFRHKLLLVSPGIANPEFEKRVVSLFLAGVISSISFKPTG